MQFQLVPAFLVFLGSYFPLAIILAVQDVTADTWHAGLCISLVGCVLPKLNNPVLSISGMALTGTFLLFTFGIPGRIRYKYPVVVIESKPIPSELISYSFPYIVSFMGVDYGSIGKIVGLIIFLAWLFLITYRAGQIIMNPILLILGWNLYEAKVTINNKENRTVKLLSKGNLIPGTYKCDVIQGIYITNGGDE
jgi:hypothetical protein